MRRRAFITALGTSIVAWPPLTARAEPSRAMPRVGALFLGAQEPSLRVSYGPFRAELQRLGYVDGKTVTLDARWPGFDSEQIRRAANDMVASAPDILLASGSPQLAALRQATARIPIVFGAVGDPVAEGAVQSFAHPGGNATGFVVYEPSMTGKWLELLKDVAPGVTRVGALYNPLNLSAQGYLNGLDGAAGTYNIAVTRFAIESDADSERAAQTMAAAPDGALVMLPDPFFQIGGKRVEAVIAAAQRYRLPTVYPYSAYVADGGLIGYGVDISDLFRRAAGYVDRILKGEHPADLPVQLPTKFTLAINLKTAKALGLVVPSGLIASADEVIE